MLMCGRGGDRSVAYKEQRGVYLDITEYLLQSIP